MRFSDFFGKNAVVQGGGSTYDEYIRCMEEMRLNYGRAQRDGAIYHPVYGKWSWPRSSDREPLGPMPIDLKAYVIARQYDGDKHTFGKVIPELVKHKDELHPFMRRYLLERLRASEQTHRDCANRFGAVADQFEIEEQPQPVGRDIAMIPPPDPEAA